ncbi:MFS general substrate transporter [Fomes fomentarius]|nr:MFS general substrate transporter [Fomes fomentarius]
MSIEGEVKAASAQFIGDEKSDISEAKLLRKIDFRVLPILCVLYLLAFLDRVNMSNAVLFGLTEDLNLGANGFNRALVIFFVPYILFEIPSNMLLKHFKPHIWLPICMCFLGFVTVLQGLTQNLGGLVATRFFLGLAESGAFPACYYLIAMWYTRTEAQKRFSFLYSSTSLAGGFGGLLASAIGKMDGMRGYRGWRWVFIIEGALTIAASFVLFFTVADFPEEVAWLSEEEKEFVKARLYDDVGHSKRHDPFTAREVVEVLKDWKITVAGFMYLGVVTSGYCYAYFAPTIIQGMGNSAIQSQLLSVPPWGCAFVFAMVVAVASDWARMRFAFIVSSLAIALTGFIILLVVHDNKHLQYAALFLAASGNFTAMPIIVCWTNTNLGGHHRRAVAVAVQVSFASVGGFISAFSFLAKDAPRYIPGYSVTVVFVGISLLSSTIYYLGITRENRRRDGAAQTRDSLSEDEKKRMGDLSPDYRYLT